MTEPARATREEVVSALRFAQEKNYEQAENLLHEAVAHEQTSTEEKAILYSTLGLIRKMQGKIDEAWSAYQQAEGILSDDPLLKLIIVRFLIQDREQYDAAIRRAKEILKLAKEIPSFSHQAYALIGLGYLKKGNKRKASEMMDKAMEGEFKNLASAENIDFQLVEAFLGRNLEIEKCKHYINAAANLARERREYKLLTIFQKALDSLETTVV